MDLKFDFASPDESWALQTSGEGEKLELFDDHAAITVGGYPAAVHYSRIRQLENPISLDTLFTLETVLELSDDFYTKQLHYVRLLGTDNFNVAINRKVWRIGLFLYSDQLPRIIVQHRNTDIPINVLWTGDGKLPLGKHKYSLTIKASETDPLTQFSIDGVTVFASNENNVPYGMEESEKLVTRQYVGLDGASDYDDSSLSLKVHHFRIFTPKSCLFSFF